MLVAQEPEDVFQAMAEDAFCIKSLAPFAPRGFAVHGKQANSCGGHHPEHLGEMFDTVFRVGVAAFGGLRQDLLGDREGDFPDHYADREHVDMFFTELPIGAIHRSCPYTRGFGEFAQDQAAEGGATQGGTEEKSLFFSK